MTTPPAVKDPPDKTYLREVRALQRRIFDRADLAKPLPWRWIVGVAGVWLLFAAFNWLVLLDRTSDREARQLAFVTGPLMVLMHWQPHTAPPWARLAVAIPGALIGLPVWAIMQDKKRQYATEALRYGRSQGRLPIKQAAVKLALKGAGVPLAVVERVVIGIAQGADQGHIGIFAPSRTGKGLHLTETLLRWQGAAVVVDPKSEQYARTAAHRAGQGAIYRIGPHCLDLLDFFDVSNPLELRELYTILTRAWQERDGIFLEKAFAVFEAAYLTSRATGEHMLRILARWTDMAAPEALKEAYRYAPGPVNKLTDGNKDELNRFAASAWGSFTAKFTPLVPFVATISTRQIPPRWLEEAATIYICYSLEDLEAAGPLVSAIMAGLIKRKRRERTREPLLCAIDELPATALPGVDKYLAEVGGAGIVMLLYIQDFAQLREIYGHDRATTIVANLHHQVYYRPLGSEAAQAMADRLGSEVEVYTSHGHDDTTSHGTRYRPAAEPGQFTAMPVSAVLVLSRGVKVIAERLNPFNDPAIVADGFPTPPTLVITDDEDVTRHYDAHGKVTMVRQPFRLVEAVRADLVAIEAERAALEPAPPDHAPAAAAVAPMTDEDEDLI